VGKVSTRKEVNFSSGVHPNVNNDDASHGLGIFRSKVSKLGKKKWRNIGQKHSLCRTGENKHAHGHPPTDSRIDATLKSAAYFKEEGFNSTRISIRRNVCSSPMANDRRNP